MACYVIQHSSNLGVGHSTVNPTTNSGIDTKWKSQANLVEKLTPSSGVSQTNVSMTQQEKKSVILLEPNSIPQSNQVFH